MRGAGVIAILVLCGAVCAGGEEVKQWNGPTPIFFFHGFGGSVADGYEMAEWVKEELPGTPFHSLALFEGKKSESTPMLRQIEVVAESIANISAANGYDEYHVIGHSQGAIGVRTLAQWWGEHKIKTLISLAGPQMGQFGGLNDWPEPIHKLEEDLAYIVLYTPALQETFSAAGYWNDPHQQARFRADVWYLPVFNNVTVPGGNPNAALFRSNFLSLSKFVLLGSPDDGVIEPWQSTQFGFWAEGGTKTIVPMAQQDVYRNDVFGLKTMHGDGRLFMDAPPGIKHSDWIHDRTAFVQYVLPHLKP